MREFIGQDISSDNASRSFNVGRISILNAMKSGAIEGSFEANGNWFAPIMHIETFLNGFPRQEGSSDDT